MGIGKMILVGLVGLVIVGKIFVFGSNTIIESSFKQNESIVTRTLEVQRGLTFRAIEAGAQFCAKHWSGEDTPPVVGKILAGVIKLRLTNLETQSGNNIDGPKTIEAVLKLFRQHEHEIAAMTPEQNRKLAELAKMFAKEEWRTLHASIARQRRRLKSKASLAFSHCNLGRQRCGEIPNVVPVTPGRSAA